MNDCVTTVSAMSSLTMASCTRPKSQTNNPLSKRSHLQLLYKRNNVFRQSRSCRLEAARSRLISTVSTLRQEISRLFEEKKEQKRRNANLEIELHLNQQAAVKNLRELERSHEAEKRLEEDIIKCRIEVEKQQHTIRQLKADLDAERE
nr:unnamed protein product [Spirometra erinaceieuropaei]